MRIQSYQSQSGNSRSLGFGLLLLLLATGVRLPSVLFLFRTDFDGVTATGLGLGLCSVQEDQDQCGEKNSKGIHIIAWKIWWNSFLFFGFFYACVCCRNNFELECAIHARFIASVSARQGGVGSWGVYCTSPENSYGIFKISISHLFGGFLAACACSGDKSFRRSSCSLICWDHIIASCEHIDFSLNGLQAMMNDAPNTKKRKKSLP